MCTVKQTNGESRRDFVARWKKEVNSVYDFDEKAVVLIFTQALRSGEFYKRLNTSPHQSYDELMRKANCFAKAEDANKQKREEEEGKGGGKPGRAGSTSQALAKNEGRDQFSRGPRLVPLRHLIPLTHPVSIILDHAEEMGIVQFPEEYMKVSPKVYQAKYCRFHRQVSHDIDECHVLKRQVKELIQRGYFIQFVKCPRQQQQHQQQGQPKNV